MLSKCKLYILHLIPKTVWRILNTGKLLLPHEHYISLLPLKDLETGIETSPKIK